MKKLEKIIKKTAEIFSIVAGASIVIAMAMVVVNVIMRKIFRNPILGVDEFTGFLAVIIISFGLAYVLLVNAHIAVDFVVEKFKIRAQGIIDAIVGLIVLGFTGVFTWNAFRYATTSMNNNQVSSTTQTPLYIFIYLMAACFLLFCLVYVIRIIESVRKARLK